ncbi:ComF family protein [Streptomyces sp. NPDC026673]|uniref:ComF family protein n=1 Tax=Streptomyces sp. NPDC026673 TaxID=3155724 RepID=UPI0033C36EE9
MREWWREISGLVLPAECAGCGAPRTGLCEECGAALHDPGARQVWPDAPPDGLPAVWAATVYADQPRAVLLAHKERGALGLARPLGEALAGAVYAAVRGGGGGGAPDTSPRESAPTLPPLLLVPVPSSRRAVAARGHDATRRLALAAAADLRRDGLSVRTAAVLRQRRAVADQSGLGARDRPANLSGALVAVRGAGRLLGSTPAVLVDDLMTTGASLAAAARAVEEAGGRVLAAAVVGGPVPLRHSAGRTGGVHRRDRETPLRQVERAAEREAESYGQA